MDKKLLSEIAQSFEGAARCEKKFSRFLASWFANFYFKFKRIIFMMLVFERDKAEYFIFQETLYFKKRA